MWCQIQKTARKTKERDEKRKERERVKPVLRGQLSDFESIFAFLPLPLPHFLFFSDGPRLTFFLYF